MLEPLSKIPDSTLWHYRLQLNIYKYIAEKYYQFEVDFMYIVGCHPDNGAAPYMNRVPHIAWNRCTYADSAISGRCAWWFARRCWFRWASGIGRTFCSGDPYRSRNDLWGFATQTIITKREHGGQFPFGISSQQAEALWQIADAECTCIIDDAALKEAIHSGVDSSTCVFFHVGQGEKASQPEEEKVDSEMKDLL